MRECLAIINSGGANACVSGWMNSTGHRKILMDEYDLEDTKIVVAQYGKYWVAVNSR